MLAFCNSTSEEVWVAYMFYVRKVFRTPSQEPRTSAREWFGVFPRTES
jgi:hypothetical protein